MSKIKKGKKRLAANKSKWIQAKYNNQKVEFKEESQAGLKKYKKSIIESKIKAYSIKHRVTLAQATIALMK